ncbi:MAG: phosphoribosylanthranilate isomerase [Treponema sp.]|jgi:phosphoribosylanthranilate isomerase|nr:phosphoribosylanthranilate isomerase [Treponema sp.]
MKIKICGLFREDDINYVNEAAPDYIGFVFADSKRRISLEMARKLRSKLAAGIIPVGVFVNAGIDVIEALYANNVISVAQLHGGEEESYIARLKAMCGIPVIKTIQYASSNGELANLDTAADFFLFDSGSGSGKSFDWGLLNFTGESKKPSRPWFLAGGINLKNIADAVSQKPYCVDISSGAESGGIKDPQKIKRLVEIVKGLKQG